MRKKGGKADGRQSSKLASFASFPLPAISSFSSPFSCTLFSSQERHLVNLQAATVEESSCSLSEASWNGFSLLVFLSPPPPSLLFLLGRPSFPQDAPPPHRDQNDHLLSLGSRNSRLLLPSQFRLPSNRFRAALPTHRAQRTRPSGSSLSSQSEPLLYSVSPTCNVFIEPTSLPSCIKRTPLRLASTPSSRSTKSGGTFAFTSPTFFLPDLPSLTSTRLKRPIEADSLTFKFVASGSNQQKGFKTRQQPIDSLSPAPLSSLQAYASPSCASPSSRNPR